MDDGCSDKVSFNNCHDSAVKSVHMVIVTGQNPSFAMQPVIVYAVF